MRTRHAMILVAVAGLLGSCATTVPRELANAREAYRQASTGPAAQVAPAELHVAQQALAKAEKSFADEKGSFGTRDLAYVAQRKAELAEATASIVMEVRSQKQSDLDYSATQGRIVADTRQDLDSARTALAASERSGDRVAAQLSAEQQARIEADRRTAEAQAALARLAAVREEPRGVVITLSGSVLFASNRSTLLPEAQKRLGQVLEVLLTTRERNLTVEGHTDSQGSDGDNILLSQRRADAVADYLVRNGYQSDLVRARGMGEGQPIADNASVEGRANNRRVVIIIERDQQSSNNQE